MTIQLSFFRRFTQNPVFEKISELLSPQEIEQLKEDVLNIEKFYQKAIDNTNKEDAPQANLVIGPYRSGKTQLIQKIRTLSATTILIDLSETFSLMTSCKTIENPKKWTPIATSLCYAILAFVTENKCSVWFEIPASCPPPGEIFEFLPQKKYSFHIYHLTLPFAERSKNASTITLYKMHDYYIKYANTISFYYREKPLELPLFAAHSRRIPEEKCFKMLILDRDSYRDLKKAEEQWEKERNFF